MAPPIRHPGTRSLLLLVVGATQILLLHSSTTVHGAGAGNNSLASPNCPDKCRHGNVSIPYPFGIGEDCFLQSDFAVTCDENGTAFISTGPGEDQRSEVLGFDLLNGEARIRSSIYSSCNYSGNGLAGRSVPLSLGHSLKVSYTQNKFTALGCATIANIVGSTDNVIDFDNLHYTSACASFCDSQYRISKSSVCDGLGCCQTSIPENLSAFYFGLFLFDELIHNPEAQAFSPCSYIFLVEGSAFKFDPSYALGSNFQQHDVLPLVLDWRISDETCDKAKKNPSSYACRAKNSECVNVTNGAGYLCNCSSGYEGNPYLVEGCQDINECHNPSQYPCNGICTNTDGSYSCTCPKGTSSEDPKNKTCTRSNQPEVKVVIGLAIGLVFLVVCIFVVMTKCEKNKLAKEKDRFFKQNGGHILYQQLLSKQVDTFTIFTVEDLKKATDNFDKSRKLGTGGHGIVYRGTLKNNKVIAVKRSKIIDVTHTDEFVQEIIILSQINHRNVVRLLGCCLDVEVPILVYEFIPNGTLFQLLHGNRDGPPLSLEIRLKIAQESAEALAYLHLSNNHSIVHGDVKSLNILLDENYTAKVTDFGASRILPKDAVQLMTMVQGTLGYLDPEYLQERKLTEKSDVYSFGVVLLELITRKTAIHYEGPGEGKSLASSFLLAMKESRVADILDTSIMGVGMEELLDEITKLASLCLNLKGEERPSMTQVADKLRAIRSTWREILLLKHEETQRQIERLRMDPVCDLSPSMFYTAQMIGLEIETTSTDHASGTRMNG